jgi:hypothetical protein
MKKVQPTIFEILGCLRDRRNFFSRKERKGRQGSEKQFKNLSLRAWRAWREEIS